MLSSKKYLINGYFPVGKALENVKIKIQKNINSNYGKIFISGKSIMSGYLNLPNLNKKNLPINGLILEI